MTDTFKLDTSGTVRVTTAFVGRDPDSLTRDRPVMVGGPVQWGNLSPFAQGYIEALVASIPNEARTYEGFAARGHRPIAFRDLAPETLARIIADCERAEARIGDGAEWGRYFWTARQGGLYGSDPTAKAPPLTVRLGDDGKVYFSDGGAS